LTDLEADSAALRMQSASLPLDVLADELGAAAGRIERELRLQDEARAARFEARLAAIELAAFKAEEERERRFQARLADIVNFEAKFRRHEEEWEARICERLDSVKDGVDGKDADIEPILEEANQVFNALKEEAEAFKQGAENKIERRLAEVKDGKDGEPGKDADIKPIWDAFNQREVNIGSAFVDLEEKIDERLAQIKDGKDGEPGKDADIEPLREEIMQAYAALKADAEEQVKAALSTVRNGKDGKDGKDGERGSEGQPGKDGKLPIAREWTNRVHYEGDVVRHNGSTYQALADTGQQPPHSDWGELASRGTDGIGFVLRGTYDASAEYKQHDIVMINRNSFAAKYDNPGECPGDGWQLFGPSGQRGKEGPPGMKGADGRSVSIAKLEADPDAMVLRITDSLGKTFELDIHPIAERIVEAAR
jgi:hypothetical protein